MAVNFSHLSLFESSEKGFFNSMDYIDGYDSIWQFRDSDDWGKEHCVKKDGFFELGSEDIVDLLPADPFGMGISATFTAITGWFEDFDRVEIDDAKEFSGDNNFLSGLNLIWNGAMRFHKEEYDAKSVEDLMPYCGSDGYNIGDDLGVVIYEGGYISFGNVEELRGCSKQTNESKESIGISSDGDSAPHDALFFVLGYLGARDLISMEGVCRSMRDAVKNDPLLWRSIHIDPPLSHRVNDDVLYQLASRAQGRLRCLCLVEGVGITDNGLKRVLESNPCLEKLSVPGCVRLSVDCILFHLKALKSAGILRIKHLRIGGLYGITNRHFEEFMFLLGADKDRQNTTRKPRFYHGGQMYLSCDDDRAIDVEMCPKCQKLRLVYDCPAESCQGNYHAAQRCRACTLCIARCIHCGRCISDCEYQETFCLDLLCLDCWGQILECQERQEEDAIPSFKHAIVHQETRYHVCFCAV
ncbi:F-box domain [Dillenia turbinata]|uniref:F-box domain n=1 Tax=Dillenia turbinata TaxID=194707 RepID=A0AAN8V6J9_9MAGN